MGADVSQLPPGFVLDTTPQANGLPAGFVLDQPTALGPAPTAGATGSWGAPADWLTEDGQMMTGTPPGPAPGTPLRAAAQGLSRSVADTAGLPGDLVNQGLNVLLSGADFIGDQTGLGRVPFRFKPVSDTLANAGAAVGDMLGAPSMDPQQMGLPERTAYEGARFAGGGMLGNVLARALGAGRIAELARPGASPEAADTLLRPYAAQPGASLAGDAIAGLGAGTAYAGTQQLPDAVRDAGGGTAGIFADLLGMGLGAASAGGAATLARDAALGGVDTLKFKFGPALPYDPQTGEAVLRRDVNDAGRFLQEQARQGAPESAQATAPQAASEAIRQNVQSFSDMGAPLPTSGLIAENPGLAAVEKGTRVRGPTPFLARDNAVRDYAVQQVDSLGPAGANPEIPVESITQQAQVREAQALRAQEEAARAAEADALRQQQEAAVIEARGRQQAPAAQRIDTAVVDQTLRPMNERKRELFGAAEGQGLTVPGDALGAAIQDIRARATSVLPGLEGTRLSGQLDNVLSGIEQQLGRNAEEAPPPAPPAPMAPARAAPPAAPPQPPAAQAPDLATRIAQTAYELAGGKWNSRVLLRDLKARFPDVPNEVLDETLKRMQSEQGGVLYRQDNRAQLTEADHAAALHIAGQPRHMLWIPTESPYAQRQAPASPPAPNPAAPSPEAPARRRQILGRQAIRADESRPEGPPAPPAPPAPPPTPSASAPGGVPYDQLNESRGALSDLANQARASGQYQLAESIDRLRAAIGRETEALAQTNPEVGAAVQNFRESYAPVWSRGPGDEATKFRRDYNADPTNRTKTPPSQTAGRFLQPTQPERADALARIAGASADAAGSRAVVRDYLLADMAKSGVAVTSQGAPAINLNRLRAWRQEWDPVLQRFPDAAAEADRMIAQASQSTDRGRQLADAVRRAEATTGEVQADIRSGPTSLVYDKAPDKAVTAVFGSGNPQRDMRAIVARLGGKEADTPEMQGWKKAVADHLQERIMNVNPGAVSQGTDTVGFAKLVREFRRNEKVLAEVYTPAEMNALRRAQKAIEPLQNLRAQATVGSPTAENSQLGMRIVEVMLRTKYGALKGGGIFRNLKIGLNALAKPELGAQRLVERAMLDPDVAVFLLDYPVREAGGPAWNSKLQAILRDVEAARNVTESADDEQ